MSFNGTQDKCKACEKTVYVVDLLSADVEFLITKACSHCKTTLKLSNYSSNGRCGLLQASLGAAVQGVSGNFNKNFQSSSAKSADKPTPELTRSPSKASRMFSGTVDKCATRWKTAYPLEKVTVGSQAYHKTCFKCSHGGCALFPIQLCSTRG